MTTSQSYPQLPPLPPPKPQESSRRMPQASPTQPAHQDQLHFPSADPISTPAAPAANPQTVVPRPPMPHQTHTRSSSFFSFLSGKNSQTPQNQRQPSPHRKLSRNISASAAGTRQNAMPQTQHQHQQSQQLQHQPPPMPPQQPSNTPTSTALTSPGAPGAPATPKSPSSSPLHPEIRSLVSLTVAHAHKIYFSGPLIRRIERQPDGQKPVKDEGWTEVWAQLGGTTLSIWDMKEIQEASQKGEEVPPTYINITDAFVQVLGSVTVPATANQPSKRYTNVLTLNTAGSNLLLFSCPTTASLISWASALRLSAWEKSRLEEIYTAHLIRITLNRPNVATTLVNGKLEGWVRIRVAGQTDWKRVWMVVGAGHEGVVTGAAPSSSAAPSSVQHKKKRMSNLFSRDQSPTRPSSPSKPVISMYVGPKPKEKKKALLSVRDITQAFAVYPERPELISRSPLIKLEGLLGDEELAQSMKAREGWVLFMPEIEGATGNQAVEMLKWVIAVHDAFELYGRPAGWTWDPREPTSLMFAYPVGPQKDLLFLDREAVETLDPRDDRTSATRSKLSELLTERMRQQQPQLVQQRPPIASRTSSEQPSTLPLANGASSSGPQLPPLSFSRPQTQERVLTPITEGGSVNTHGRGMSLDAAAASPVTANQLSQISQTPPSQVVQDKPASPAAILDRGLSNSPAPASHAPTANTSNPPVTLVETRPSAKSSITSSASFDIPSRGAVDQKQPPISVSSPPPTKTDTASRGSTPVTEKNVANTRNNNLTVTPAGGGGLVSPYSPIRSPGGMAHSDSTSSVPPKSPNASILTSPYSHHDHLQTDRMSVLTSPHSVHEAQEERINRDNQPLQAPSPNFMNTTSTATQPTPKSPTVTSKPAGKTHEPEDNFLNEAGALYFMRQSQIESGGSGLSNKPRQVPMPKSSDEDEDEESDSSGEYTRPKEISTGTASAAINNTRSGPVRKGTPMAFMERASTSSLPSGSASTSPGPAGPSSPTIAAMAPSVVAPLRVSASPGSDRGNVHTTGNIPLTTTATSSRVGLGRKPSGARAQATSRTPYNSAGLSASHQLTEEEETGGDDDGYNNHHNNNNGSEQQKMQSSFTSASSRTAAQPAQNQVPLSSPTPSQPKTPAFVKNLEEQGEVGEADEDVLAALSYLNVADEGSSSVRGGASGKGEPLKVATQDRLGGGVAAGERPPLSASSASDSAAGPQFKSSFAPSTSAAKRKAKAQAQQAAHQAAVHRPGRANGKKSKATGGWNDSTDEEEEDEEEEEDDDDEDADSDGKVLPPRMQQNAPARPSVYGQLAGDGAPQSHLRPPRTLPQPPIARAGTDDQHNLAGRRAPSDGYSDRRTYYDDGTQIRTQADFPPPGAARQTVWSQVLEPGKGVNPSEHPHKDTFVQLDTSETMTKAFTPQGLLSAGLQDKQDRSAKRQEELARETGASLINVPNKPPPPQTGLLGAITAHERERKREGGVGAALTEREREKRLAEERQRRFDDQQRQQLEQMQQGGSMYGGYGFNPMMNPMMMGMNPMMMNPMMGGGMSPVMTGGGMNPMMTGGGMNPMMTGGGMNPMMGYPNMLTPQQMFAAQQAAAAAYQQAMMTFSVAGSQVGGEAGGNQPGNMPMGPNMTGGNMSGFDPRMSMMGMPMMGGMGMGMGMTPTMTGNFDSRPPPGTGGENGGLLPPGGHNQFSSQTSSPVGRGSPLARPTDSGERPATPKH